MVVDELCPGKCKGKSYPAVTSVPSMAVGLLEQRLETMCRHGVMSSVVVALEKSGSEESEPDHLVPIHVHSCAASGLRQGEG